MSREKQIEVLKKDICLAADYCYGACDECNLGSLAKSLYDAGYRKQSEPFSQPHENGSEWISVEERLPETNMDCLLLLDTEEIVIGYCRRDLHAFVEGGIVLVKDVTHWMPLPEAPKKGGAE